MSNTQLKVPFFAKGTKESLQIALASGVFASLDRVAFVFLTDALEWVLIDTNKQTYTLRGFTEEAVKKYVQRGNSLPPVEEALTDVLYVVDDVVYTFDGTEYHKTFDELESTVNELQIAVDNCATKDMIGDLPLDTDVVTFVNESSVAVLDQAVQYTDEAIELHIVD